MRLAVVILILFTVVGLSPGQEMVDRILAIVDDDIIMESEILQYAQSIALQNRSDPAKYMQDPKIKSQILQELIDQKVMLTWAQEDTEIVVEDREVKRELDTRLENLVKQVGSEEELEKLYGKPMREIRRDFEQSIRGGFAGGEIPAEVDERHQGQPVGSGGFLPGTQEGTF